jgi:hypothetical protein
MTTDKLKKDKMRTFIKSVGFDYDNPPITPFEGFVLSAKIFLDDAFWQADVSKQKTALLERLEKAKEKLLDELDSKIEELKNF